MSDGDWANKLREAADDLTPAVRGSKKQIDTLLAAADMIDRAPPAARRRIAHALRIRHPQLTMLPILTDREELDFSVYPRAGRDMQAELVLGKTPAEVTGLTAREAHEYLSEGPGIDPANWLLDHKEGPNPWLRGHMWFISIRSVPVARWVLQRWKDPAQRDALTKTRVERGPAGEEICGPFICRTDELVESDLTPSVKKTFENASERLRLEFEKEMLRPKNQKRLAAPPAWYKEMPGITLLDKGAQLVMEGREMKHCVATYIGKVRNGFSTILSIRVPTDDGHVLRSTVELSGRAMVRDPMTVEVIQHRGFGNEPPSEQNMKALAHALEVWLTPAVEKLGLDQRKAALSRIMRDARLENPVPAELHARIARALGWSVADTYKFSLPTLRELVLDQELRGDITNVIAGGQHLTMQPPPRRRRR